MDLKPTTIITQLADHTLRRPASILEDVPIRVGKFIIPCNFIVMDMNESSRVPVILRRSFLAAIGTVVDVQEGTLSF